MLEAECALVEAILLLEAEPVDAATIAQAAAIPKSAVLEAITKLQERYESVASGLEIVSIAGGFLLSPKATLWSHLSGRYGKKNGRALSRAAMETLSIVAYSQPVTRGEIESIRGVSADGMIRLLTDKDLIHTVGKRETPGRPVLYGTTKEFLRTFRLSSIADLPRLDSITQERFELDGN